MNPKLIPQGIVSSIILLIILNLITASSILPWKILSHENIWIRILGWYFFIQLGLLFLAFFALKVIPDQDCPICNKDLKAFSPVFGPPMSCPNCGTWFHKNCRAAKPRCPICYPELEQEDGFIDFTGGFRS